MVGLALLLGCDYCPQGVPGVGREGALRLLRHCSTVSQPLSTAQEACKDHKSHDLLDLFRVWQKGRLLDQKSAFEERVQRY